MRHNKKSKIREGSFFLNRREFLSHNAALIAGLSIPEALAAGQAQRSDQPLNVILIHCDDLNDTVAGMGGHPQAKTPNIDKLMQRGMRFTNAHCNAPICAPSRASMWTGIYPHTSGLFGYSQDKNNWRRNPTLKDAVTVFEHFVSHGYAVYGTGKVFHNGHEDDTVWLHPDGFNGLGFGPSFGPFPWDGVSMHPSKKRKFTGHPSMPPEYQEDIWGSFAPLSDVPTVGSYTGWSMETQDFHYVNEDDRDLMPDEKSASWVEERLAGTHEKPFFITVGLNRPHEPRYVPTKYYDLFPLDDIHLPPYQPNDLADCAKILWIDPDIGVPTQASQALKNIHNAGGVKLWKRWIQSYLAAVAYIDAQVGQILDALDESPYAETTMVILSSDHGYQMGEKEHMHKETVWEEVTRVPLVVAVPRLTPPGTECQHPVSLIDLYPTLIDLCGLSPDPNAGGNGVPLGGFSLRSLLEDPGASWAGPAVALSCRHGKDEIPPNHPGRINRQHYSVRSDRWRYTLCYNGEEELYDHENDMNEWTNLASAPAYAEIKAALRQQMLVMLGLL